MHDALPIWVDEEWVAAVLARLGVAREAGAFGRQIFEARPLGLGQVARETHRSDRHPPRRVRSEEHTSELQSLMRISYAVFCLKKKSELQQTHNTFIRASYQVTSRSV